MRRALFTVLLALAAVPTAAVAQLPAPPPVPTVPLPLPLPVPTAPLPTLPAVPAPAPPAAPQPPAVSPASGSPSTPSAGSGPTSSGARTSGRSGRATTPERRPSVVLAFRVPSSGRVAIRLRQVAPVCRNAGRLLVPARNGANRLRFNGRISGRPLRDGTYVATTPSGTVRFAIVDGKPTRSAKRLAPSVCGSGVLGASTAVAATPSSKSPPDRTAAAPAANGDRGAADQPGPLPRVLGTTFTEVSDAAASLHPAFYVLLALAMVALAAATVPARVLPVATAGAVLARHRAVVTLTGTLCLLLVIVAYWVTLL